MVQKFRKLLLSKFFINKCFYKQNYSSAFSKSCLCYSERKIEFNHAKRNIFSSFTFRDANLSDLPPKDIGHSTISNKEIDKMEVATFHQDKERVTFQKWLDMYKFSGGEVPEYISEESLEIAFYKYQESIFQAKKYLRFLLIKEVKKKKNEIKKIELKEKIKTRRAKFLEEYNEHLIYRLWHHSMYGRIYKTALNHLYNHKLSNALQFGQPFVIDFGFDCHSTDREISSLRDQVKLCIKENSMNSDPFNMYFCNLDQNIFYNLKEHINVLNDSTFPMNITSKSYLDFFPKDKLIYLTPDSRTVMKKFEYDSIYIIGGIVDLKNKKPLTLAKAKKEGLRTMKLPLLQYMEFKHKPSLAIHIMLTIMLELQSSGDFVKAFKYIPRRFLKDPDFSFGESPWDQDRTTRRFNKILKSTM